MSAIKKSNIQERIRLPSSLTLEQVRAVGERVVQQNRANAKSGLDGSGKPLPTYSTAYKESLDFKNGGKSSKVTLTLSGDMLAELSLLDYGLGFILVGYATDNDEAAKAHGNVTGEYGQSKSTGKNRPFIGVPSKQLERIIAEVRSQTVSERIGEDVKTRTAVASILARFGIGGSQ